MKLWLQSLVTIGTLINIIYHFLFPQLAFASQANVETEPVARFPYDKELAVEYAKRKAKSNLMERLWREANVHYHTITAYSSTVWQTDASPFITATGKRVREGIVAANTLPFGSKIMIPELFGEKIFTVEDRMASKNYHKIDIWFPSTYQAKQFGVKKTKIFVIPQDIAEALENQPI